MCIISDYSDIKKQAISVGLWHQLISIITGDVHTKGNLNLYQDSTIHTAIKEAVRLKLGEGSGYEHIYKVTTEGDSEGRTTRFIAYATGKLDDVLAYFDKDKTYDIHAERVEPIIVVTSDMVSKRNELYRKRDEINKQIAELENRK